MRWKINKPEFKVGDTRRVSRFAFWPTEVEDYTVWLEFYISVEEMKNVDRHCEFGKLYSELKWVEFSREIPIYYP